MLLARPDASIFEVPIPVTTLPGVSMRRTDSPARASQWYAYLPAEVVATCTIEPDLVPTCAAYEEDAERWDGLS